MDEQLIVPTVIRNLDLAPVRERLVQKNGWTAEYADRMVEEYREYLAQFYFHLGEKIVPPTQDLDDVWHALSFQRNESGGFDTVILGSSCTSYMPPAHEHSSFLEGWFSGGCGGGGCGGGGGD